MKNAIIELTSCEIENVSGGMEWRLPWEYGKFFVAVCMAYNYKDLATYKTIKSLKNYRIQWENIEQIAVGLFNDVFNFSFIFLGLDTLINGLIPFVVIKGIKLFTNGR